MVKDYFGVEYKVGDFISYSSSKYTTIRIGVITKITPKTFKYFHKDINHESINAYSDNEYIETVAVVPNSAIIINKIIPKEIKENLINELEKRQLINKN